jgi:hypothetical protein
MQHNTRSSSGLLMRAARRALETGNADHILIWVPAGSENTLKNLHEKACCEHTIRTGRKNPAADWYYRKACCFHASWCGPHDLDSAAKTPEGKKIISLVEQACESGSLAEITMVMPATAREKLQQQFDDLRQKQTFSPEDICAGRRYVEALSGFTALVKELRAGTACQELK